MKVKVSEAPPMALNWMITKAGGGSVKTDHKSVCRWIDGYSRMGMFNYSTNWSQGGPIIEREGINIRAIRKPGHSMDGKWLAAYDHNNTGTMVHWVKRTTWHRHYSVGDTALVAAMCCYVASKLGDEVDIPEELL